MSSIWSHFPFRSLVKGTGLAGCHVALEVLVLDILVQTPTDSGFLVLIKCDHPGVCPLPVIIHLFLDLTEAPTLGRSLVSRICSQKKNNWSRQSLVRFALLSLSRFFKAILFCISLL